MVKTLECFYDRKQERWLEPSEVIACKDFSNFYITPKASLLEAGKEIAIPIPSDKVKDEFVGVLRGFRLLQKSPEDTSPYLTSEFGTPSIKGLYIFYNEDVGKEIKKLFPDKIESWDEALSEVTDFIEQQVELKWNARKKLIVKSKSLNRSAKKRAKIKVSKIIQQLDSPSKRLKVAQDESGSDSDSGSGSESGDNSS